MLLLPEKAGTEARRHRRGSVPALFGGTLGKFSEPYKLSACCALCHQSPDFFNVCIISEIVDQHSIYYKHKETRFLQSQGNWFPVYTGMFHDDSSIHSNSLSVETSFFQITVCMAHIERSHHDFATRSAYCSCKQCFCLYKNTFCVAKRLLGSAPNPFDLHFSMQATPPCGVLLRMSIVTSYEKACTFLVQGSIEEFDGSWYNSRRCVLCGLHTNKVKRSY